MKISFLTVREVVLILLSGILANLSIRNYPILLNSPDMIKFFHDTLNLPGSGGGAFMFGGIFVFWATLAAAFSNKKGAAFLVAIAMVAFGCIIGAELWKNKIAAFIDIFLILFQKKEKMNYLAPALTGVVLAVCIVQIALGQKLWLKETMWPSVPVFMAIGGIFIPVTIRFRSPYISAVVFGMCLYIVYLWFTIFFPPRSKAGLVLLMLTVIDSAIVFSGLALIFQRSFAKFCLEQDGGTFSSKSQKHEA